MVGSSRPHPNPNLNDFGCDCIQHKHRAICQALIFYLRAKRKREIKGLIEKRKSKSAANL